MARAGHSAGLLPFRVDALGIHVFIAHMGGPFWARRDDGGWSISKGEYDPATEEPRDVARREFREEIGVDAPGEPWIELGALRMPSGKRITAYAAHGPAQLAYVESNLFEME